MITGEVMILSFPFGIEEQTPREILIFGLPQLWNIPEKEIFLRLPSYFPQLQSHGRQGHKTVSLGGPKVTL